MGRIKNIYGRILNGTISKGYIKVTTEVKCITVTEFVHRLVAYGFLDCDDEMIVNHKNGVKSDNRLENVEVVTAQENVHHAINIGLVKYNTIRVAQMDLNNNVLNTFNSIKKAAAHVQTKDSNIGQVCRGKRMTAAGFK